MTAATGSDSDSADHFCRNSRGGPLPLAVPAGPLLLLANYNNRTHCTVTEKNVLLSLARALGAATQATVNTRHLVALISGTPSRTSTRQSSSLHGSGQPAIAGQDRPEGTASIGQQESDSQHRWQMCTSQVRTRLCFSIASANMVTSLIFVNSGTPKSTAVRRM